MKKVNCYIHIPFCTSKCKYCRFASFSGLNQLKIENYVKFLCEEIKFFSYKVGNAGINSIQNQKITLETIYFGGGTPSTLSISQFERIFDALKQKFLFSKNIEISIESTPENVILENLVSWEKLGINRLSIGVQSLNEKTLEEIARAKKGSILDCLNNLEKFFKEFNGGITISLDFIIGLPFVKKGELLENIKFVLEKYNFVKHISVYMLEEYYDVPEEIDSKFDNIIYPNSWKANSIKEEDFLGEYLSIKNFLEEKGFNRYEISNFSKLGFECKHNLGYWNHKENLAFGLGAHGFLNNIRFSNSEDFLEYYAGKNISKEKIGEKEKFLEKIMFQLRTSGIEKKYLKFLNENKLKYFLGSNPSPLLEERENKIVLKDDAILFLDYILDEIL
ncbi:hypothetical protein DLH72_04690 [Candidatus Gracilibacteria bacterium]|nr:MAG: hypothetical protein DLH72_04690 [Candidatus Gracilibacteria bacterium]